MNNKKIALAIAVGLAFTGVAVASAFGGGDIGSQRHPGHQGKTEKSRMGDGYRSGTGSCHGTTVKRGEVRKGFRFQRFLKDGLTDTEKESVSNVFENHSKEMRAIASGTGSSEVKRIAIEAAMMKLSSDLSPFVNPDNKNEFDEFVKRMSELGSQHGKMEKRGKVFERKYGSMEHR